MQGASVDNIAVTKSDLNEVIHQIQNTIQALRGYHLDPSNNVINLSTKTFTFYEFKLSNKNLNFCPIPNHGLTDTTRNSL